MSIQTDGTADNFATNTSAAPVTGDPVTISVWFQRSADAAGTMVALGQSGTALNKITLYVAGDGTIQARKYDGVGNTNAVTTAGVDDTATWHHACGVFVSDTVRYAYLDGGSKGTSATTTRTSSAYSALRIGGMLDGTLRFNGLTAHIAIWNKALSDAQVLSLAEGANPTTIELANLAVYYTTLASGDAGADSIGSYDLTFTDTAGYSSTNPTVDAALTKYLRLLAEASAASAADIEGVVLNAARDTVIGEFSGQAFAADLVGGEAVLLVPVASITPDGSTLTTSDEPLVFAYNATDSIVGPGSATVIEV